MRLASVLISQAGCLSCTRATFICCTFYHHCWEEEKKLYFQAHAMRWGAHKAFNCASENQLRACLHWLATLYLWFCCAPTRSHEGIPPQLLLRTTYGFIKPVLGNGSRTISSKRGFRAITVIIKRLMIRPQTCLMMQFDQPPGVSFEVVVKVVTCGFNTFREKFR